MIDTNPEDIAFHHHIAKQTVMQSRIRPPPMAAPRVSPEIVEVEQLPSDVATKKQELGDRKVYFMIYTHADAYTALT